MPTTLGAGFNLRKLSLYPYLLITNSYRNYSKSHVPRMNKRFRISVIKRTNDHNKAVLKAQAAAAQELKREREEQERRNEEHELQLLLKLKS